MKATIIVAVILLAGGLVWNKLFSKDARIEAAYRACIKDAGAAAAAVTTRSPRETTVVVAARGVDELVQGAVRGLGGAACETVRSRCRDDYGGDLCQAALRQYR
jgi:hypothetical protein